MWQKIIGFHNDAAGRELSVLQDVYKSESDTNQRNQAIGALMLAYGYIKTNWHQAVDLYTRQCSIGVNAQDLATMAAMLAAGGKNPVTGKHVLDAANVPSVLAVMSTAGLYDDSGKWLYHTGLPAKSGVGGGIIAVSPGKFGIAVVSPPLDDAGNSVRAQRAIADISGALGGNPYAPRQPSRPRRRRRASRSTGSRCSTSATTSSRFNPNWFDTLRLTKLPSFKDQFGEDQQHVRGCTPEPPGRALVDADRTRRTEDHLRVRAVRHGRGRRPDDLPPAPCVGRTRHISAPVSTWSPFTDPDVFPNSLEYWGPTGMVLFRNVQLRWMPIDRRKAT